MILGEQATVATQSDQEYRASRQKDPWEERIINGEMYLVIKDLKALFTTETQRQPTVFTYDEYRHVESGMQIQVWKVGTEQPVEKPAIVRLDYACPCMQGGAVLHMMGHDCSQQRDIMFRTIAQVGVGAIATISEETAAGNGHGSHAVLQQATLQYEALMQGQPIPSMQEAYNELGYFNDKRHHDIAACALADSIGTARPVLATTANEAKLAELRKAGLNVIDNFRVELVTPFKSKQSRMLESSRRRASYLAETAMTKPGAYLVSNTDRFSPIRITKKGYPESLNRIQAPPRRSNRRLIN